MDGVEGSGCLGNNECIGATILKASPPTIFSFRRNPRYVLPAKRALPAFPVQRRLILVQTVQISVLVPNTLMEKLYVAVKTTARIY